QIRSIMSMIEEEYTIGLPRFMSFIELGYLLEAAKVADDQLQSKIDSLGHDDKRNQIGNINATRQSLLRAVFISTFSVLEQHLDEMVLMMKSKSDIKLSPSDLKDRGIRRSLTYLDKVLGKPVDTTTKHWQDVFILQSLRNHLVHYGPDFSNSNEHQKSWRKFKQVKYVTLRPMICFTVEQIEEICEVFVACVDDFISA
ncbi:TPA: hypothetical protein ACN4A8_004710, partial [Vibrio parahaemolyticus]